MIELLRFLIEHLPFLIATGRYRFVESEATSSFGGNAYVLLASRLTRLRLVRDREQLFLDVQSVSHEREQDWFSLELIRWLLTGLTPATAELSVEGGLFLRDNLDEIEERFGSSRVDATTTALDGFRRARAKELFG